MRTPRTWPVTLVALAGVAVAVLSGYLLISWPPEPPRSSAATAPASAPTPAATGGHEPAEPGQGPPVLAVLGDGFSAPNDVSDGPEWPLLLADQLGWQADVDAADDTGFLSAASGRPLPERVPDVLAGSPDLVIVAGGESDLGRYPVEEVADAAETTVRALLEELPAADVVLTSPFSNGPPGPLTTGLTDALRQVARDHGVGYVDVSDWLTESGQLFSTDPDHPLDPGQQRIADRMRAQLQRLGTG